LLRVSALLGLLVAAALSPGAGAAELAEAFGRDTYVYVSIPSVPVLRANGGESAYGAILGSEEMTRFLAEGFPALTALEDRFREIAGRDFAGVLDLATGRAALAMVPDTDYTVAGVAALQIDESSGEFQDFIDYLAEETGLEWNDIDVPGTTVRFAQTGPAQAGYVAGSGRFNFNVGTSPAQVAYATAEGHFIVGTSLEAVRVLCLGILSGRSDNLATNETYAKCRAKARSPQAELEAFVHLTPLVNLVLLEAPPEVRPVLDEIGLTGLAAIRYSSSPAGKGFTDRALLYFPDGRGGIFAALEAAPDEYRDFLESVPSNTLSANWLHVNPGVLWDSIAAAVRTVAPPEGLEGASSGLASMEESAGVSLRDDLVGNLSGNIVTYSVIPSQTLALAFGGGMGQTVISVGLSDEERFTKAFDACWDHLAELAAEAQAEGGTEAPFQPQVRFNLNRRPFGEATVYEAALALNPAMQITPSLAISQKRLFVATDLQTLRNALTRPEDTAGLGENEDYIRAAGFAGEATAGASYANTPAVFESVYSLASVFLPLVTAQMKVPSPVDILLMPPAQSFSRHLVGTAEAIRADEDSITATSHGPMGILRTLWLMGIGGAAIGNWATTHFIEEVTERTQLKRLGLALLMYSNDNDGAFPPDLATLKREGSLKRVDTERVRYVRGLMDYDAPGLIIAFSTETTPAGRAALFVDGHVMHITDTELVEQIGGWLELGAEPTPAEIEAACEKNLRTLAASLERYAEFHEGRLPDALDKSADYRFAPLVVNCPADDEIGESDYGVIAGLDISTVVDEKKGSVVLVYEKSARHDGKAGVVFLDGTFDRIPADELEDLIEASRNQ
jgi:hypothetical protein